MKPENFLFHDPTPESQLKVSSEGVSACAIEIIDFGLACQFEPGKKMSTKASSGVSFSA